MMPYIFHDKENGWMLIQPLRSPMFNYSDELIVSYHVSEVEAQEALNAYQRGE